MDHGKHQAPARYDGEGCPTTLIRIPVRIVVLVVVLPVRMIRDALVLAPLRPLYRRVLAPVGQEIAAAFGVARRVAGYISRAVGRAVVWPARHLVGAPVTWVHRTVCTPVGHCLRDQIWAPAKRGAVEAGRAARSALRSARDRTAGTPRRMAGPGRRTAGARAKGTEGAPCA